MKLQRREIITLMIGLMIILGLLYYTYYFQPFKTEGVELDSNVTVKTAELNALQSRQTQIPSMWNEIDDLTSVLSESSSNIIPSKDNVLILVYLEEILKDTALNKNISFDAAPIVLDYCNLQSVSISFNTDYDSLKIILNELENSIYENSISNMNISYSDVEGEYFNKLTEETGELPGVDITGVDEDLIEPPQIDVVEKISVFPYNIYVVLSVQFYYYSDLVDPNKEYDFAQGDYFNNDIIPRPNEILIPVQKTVDVDE